MFTYLKRSSAAITIALLLSGLGTMAPAQETLVNLTSDQVDPFVASTERCAVLDSDYCITTTEPGHTVLAYIESVYTSKRSREGMIPSVLEGNDWDTEMLDRVVPAGVSFAMVANPS